METYYKTNKKVLVETYKWFDIYKSYREDNSFFYSVNNLCLVSLEIARKCIDVHKEACAMPKYIPVVNI